MNDSYSNPFMNTFTKVVDTLVLSILWLVCSLPVFTVGAASGALYYAYHKTIRQDRSYPVKTFFKAFRSNFSQATAIWMLVLVFGGMSAFACYCLYALRGSFPAAGVLLAIGVEIIIFLTVWCLYMFAYQARFENRMVAIMANSAVLVVANLHWSLLLLAMFAAVVLMVLWKPVMFAPAAAVFIWAENRILERVFRKIMTEEMLLSEAEADQT